MAVGYNPRTITDGLVLCLDAGNPKSYPGSGTTWTDLSGRRNNGTLTNGPTYSSLNGGSIVFDGTNDTVIIPASDNLGFETQNFTIEVWVYLNSVGTNMGIVSKGPSSTSGWLVRMNGSNVMFVQNTSANLTSTTALLVNTWYHVAVVREGTGTNQTKLYINGVNEDTSTLTNNFSTTLNTYVGSNRGSGVFLNGYVSNFRLYKGKGLTSLEIKQNFNALRGRFGI